MSKYAVVVAFLLSSVAFAAPLSRQLNVSTEIDRNKFFSGEFMDVRFVPDSLVAVYDKSQQTFIPLDTNLWVTTNIHKTEVNTGFTAFLSENIVTCFNDRGEVMALTPSEETDLYGFARLSIDGVDIPIGKAHVIPKFNITVNDVLEGYYPASISFRELSATNLSMGKCSGSISIRVEFNI